MSVESLDDDDRSAVINVAGPAALLVAKLHKVGERVATPNRRNDKDAHDIYRLLVAIETPDLAETMQRLHAAEISLEATTQALLLEATLRKRRCPRRHDGRSRRRRSRPPRHCFGFGPLPRAGHAVGLGVIGDGAPAVLNREG